MFSEFEQVPPEQTTEWWWEFTAALVRHEVAEVEIVYPQVRRSVPNGTPSGRRSHQGAGQS